MHAATCLATVRLSAVGSAKLGEIVEAGAPVDLRHTRRDGTSNDCQKTLQRRSSVPLPCDRHDGHYADVQFPRHGPELLHTTMLASDPLFRRRERHIGHEKRARRTASDERVGELGLPL